MKTTMVFVFIFFLSLLLAGNVTFSNKIFKTENFIDGIEIDNCQTSLFPDSIFSYPNCNLLKPDSIFCNHKYYLIILHSPYTTLDCYNANFSLVDSLSKKFPEQVYLLSEFWEIRDVKKSINRLGLDNNIKIILDGKAKNILKLSELDEDFINAGFVIIDTHLKIHYILMGSYKYPYSSQSLKKLSGYVNTILRK